MPKFVYDKEHMRFNLKKVGFADVLWIVAKYFLISVALAVVYYLLFSLVFDTDKERALTAENKALRQEYERLNEKMDIVDNVISSLEYKDREIYNDVFNADPPSYAAIQDTLRFDYDELLGETEENLIWDTYAMARKIEFKTGRVEGWLASINAAFEDDGTDPTSIPSIIPVRNFSTLQTGASVGKKVNPFFKSVREHTGVDLVSPSGTEVICAADGVVLKIEKTGKGFGNRVTVKHGERYQTTYSHLADNIIVRGGQVVKQGTVLGRVGSSGTTFAPCLHYEVIKDGEYQDPVNYFFSDLNPYDYKEMMIISMTTGQSID